MADRLPAIGFWAYSRSDDDISDGRLSQLRQAISRELRAQIGLRPVELFQDVASISHGMAWEQAIRDALIRSSFLIPILSPAFLESKWCWLEYQWFRESMALRELGPAIFPIWYLDIANTDALDADAVNHAKTIQWFDFRGLRFESLDSPRVRSAIADFAGSIVNFLNKPRGPRLAEVSAPVSGSAAQIFISYDSGERPRAAALATALQRAGYAVWWDRDLDAGERYSDIIEEAINGSKAALVLWSREARKSDWVRSEARLAHRRGIYLPVTLDGAEPPLGLNEQHCTSLENWSGDADDAALQPILRAVRKRVGA